MHEGDGAKSGERGPERVLWALGAGILVATGSALAALLRPDHDLFVLAFGIHGVLYAAAVALVLRAPFGQRAVLALLGIAVLARAVASLAPPVLTTDAYRYVWDGRVQKAGINPYLYVPVDPRLEHLRDPAVYPHINRKETYPTIYPPLAEMVFRAGVAIEDSMRGMKILMALVDIAVIGLMLVLLKAAALPASRVLIYAWHPLILWEMTGASHIDVAAIACIVLALIAAHRGRQGWAGIALAGAGLVKYQMVLLTPALWRRWSWRMPAAMLATAALLYLPYAWGAGPLVLGSLFQHLGEQDYNGYGFYLIGLLKYLGLPYPSTTVYVGLAGAVLLGLGFWSALRTDPGVVEPRHLLALTAAFLILLSPPYPWYYAVLVPLLCLHLSWPLVFLSLAAGGHYLEFGSLLEPFTRFKLMTILFGGSALLALIYWVQRRREAQAADARFALESRRLRQQTPA